MRVIFTLFVVAAAFGLHHGALEQDSTLMQTNSSLGQELPKVFELRFSFIAKKMHTLSLRCMPCSFIVLLCIELPLPLLFA